MDQIASLIALQLDISIDSYSIRLGHIASCELQASATILSPISNVIPLQKAT